jgi:tetratricopeptide (TPR) repeat protein
MEASGVNLATEILPPNCPYDNALYCEVSNDSFDFLAQTFLSALGLAESRAGATAEQIIEMILTTFHRQRWLVIIDNLETLLERGSCRAVSPDVGKLLYELAYGNHNSQIVITSRKVPADLEERRGHQIDRSIIRIEPVGGISPSDSLVLLENLGAKDNQEDLDWIVDRVGGNILVLKLLADYSSKYPGKLRKQPELVTDKAEPIIRAQWAAQTSAAQNLLKRMCVLRIGMDVKALTTLRLFSPIKNLFSRKKAAQEQTEILLKGLVNSGLVEETYNLSTSESEYKLHPLVAETLQAIFKKEEKQLWLYAAKLYESFKPPQKMRNIEDWKFGLEKLYFWWLLGNRNRVIRIVIKSLLPSLGQWGYWGEQQKWCDRILPATEGSNHRYCLQTLGCICRDTGKWAEAEDYFQRSLTFAKQAGDRVGMATILAFLGDLASKRGESDRAEALYYQSLEVRIKLADRVGMASSWDVLGNIASKRTVRNELGILLGMASSWGVLGDLASKRGESDRAEVLYLPSLEVLTKLADRVGMASSWGVLGDLATKRREYDRAEDFYKQSLIVLTRLGDRAGMATILASLGDLATKRGEFDRAEALYYQSLEVRTDLGDRAGMATSWLLGNIAHNRAVSSKLGDLAGMATILRTIAIDSPPTSIHQSILVGMATILASLGDIARNRDDYDKAEALYHKSLAVRTDLGDLAGMASSWGVLGDLANKREEYYRAEALYHQCLVVRTELDDRAGMASSWGLLGDLANKRGEYDRAEALYKQSLAVCTKLGDRAGMAATWGCLGENELGRGNLATAETWLKQALTVFEELQIPYSLAEIHWDFARLCRAKGDELQGQAHYAISHDLYSKLGATKDLEKIEREWNVDR